LTYVVQGTLRLWQTTGATFSNGDWRIVE